MSMKWNPKQYIVYKLQNWIKSHEKPSENPLEIINFGKQVALMWFIVYLMLLESSRPYLD